MVVVVVEAVLDRANESLFGEFAFRMSKASGLQWRSKAILSNVCSSAM